MSTWNRNRFSVFTSDEKDVLGLVEELGKQTNANADALANKTDLNGDHKGTWQGLTPTQTEEGLSTTVKKHSDDIENIILSLDSKATKTELNTEKQKIINLENDNVTNKNNIANINGANSITINVKYHNIEGLPKCNMNDSSGELKKLQAIHDYCEQNFDSATIVIPPGDLFINDTLYWNFTKVNMKCHGKIKVNIKNLTKYAIVHWSKSEFLYEQNRFTIKGLDISALTQRSCNGILLKETEDKNGSNRFTFENCSFYGFDNAITMSDRSYLITFDKCSIHTNRVGIDITEGYDCGENYRFVNSAIFNNELGFMIDNPNSTLFFDGCSIDYNYGAICRIKRGQVFINGCHLEHRLSDFVNTIPFQVDNLDGALLQIDNSFIMFNGTFEQTEKPQYIISTGDVTLCGVKISNCFLQGFYTKSGYISNNYIRVEKSKCNQWDINKTCKFPSLGNNKVFDNWYSQTDTTKFHNQITISEWTGNKASKLVSDSLSVNIATSVFSQSRNGIAFRKLGVAQSFGAGAIVVPINEIDSIYGIRFYIKGNASVNTDYNISFCNYNHSDGKLYDKNVIKSETVALTGQEKLITLDVFSKNKWCNNSHIALEFNLFNNVKDNVVWVSGVEIMSI